MGCDPGKAIWVGPPHQIQVVCAAKKPNTSCFMGCLTAVSSGRSAGGSYCKVRNNNMKVLDLALVALLQPPVSNKIPCYVFFKTRPSTTRRNDQCCILRVSDQCKGKCWYRMVSSHTCLNQLHDCLTPSETFGQQKFFLAASAESLYAFFLLFSSILCTNTMKTGPIRST